MKHAIACPWTIGSDRWSLNSVSIVGEPLFKNDTIVFIAVQLLKLSVENLDCTLVFVDENIMNSNQLLIKHRLIVTELNEHYVNYMSKKALAIDCLDSIKANLKLQSLGDRGYDTFASNEQKMHMSKHLYSKSLIITRRGSDLRLSSGTWGERKLSPVRS